MHLTSNKYDELHVPVLLEPVLRYLNPQAGENYLDLTAGYGGHAAAILERSGTASQSVLVDRDARAIEILSEKFKDAELRHQDFLTAASELAAQGRQFDIILADLGVSSPHLNEGSRGFSINYDAPLDMRMDQSQTLTAEQVVNSWPEADLARILRDWGEEPKAALIAQRIVQARPLHTTSELATIAKRAWPGHSRVHPATRTFQAIRIAVNDELRMLEETLPRLSGLLAPGGRLGVISFHSLEDRIVKRYLAEQAGERYDADMRILAKRPVTADADELVFNPRSRSAKLRVAAKQK